MSRRSLIGLALAAILPLAGCTADADEPVTPPSPPKRLTSADLKLVAFDSCAQLTKDLRAAAKSSVGPWGFGGDEHMLRSVPEGARAAAADSAAEAAPPPPAFSGTNVHEAGVDEPDIVKTDGRRIVTVHQGVLRVIDAATKRETGRIKIDAFADPQLLLSGDRALVLTAKDSGPPNGRIAYDGPMHWQTTPEIILVDLAGAPRVISRYEGSGRVVDARQVGDTARVVLSRPPRIKFPEQPNARDDSTRLKANRGAIDKAPADAWLPEWSVTTGDTTEKGRVGCDAVHRPVNYSGGSMLTVLTFSMSAAKLDSGRPVSIVADGDTVYGTPTGLYVANDQRWRLDRFPGRSNADARQETDIYRFDVTGSEPPVYRAGGVVPGVLINQYAMSEWKGHLRVATTEDDAKSSSVRVLRTEDLSKVGEVTGLGKDERIYSVRFMGDRGYVVTFRQTDPLYSLDLSSPGNPRVTGELKITGFSSHLQPVGPDRLIGIGQEADTDGRRQGTQVSLFDVSDPESPQRLAQHHIAGGFSEAEHDPHAILWWPASNLLVIPLITIDGGATPQKAASALALRVTADGVSKAGDLAAPLTRDGYAPQIRRSLVIGDSLWTLSESGLTASRLSTLEPVATVKF